MAGITFANHIDAGLVETKAVYLEDCEVYTHLEGVETYQDTNAEGGVHVGKAPCDRIARGIKESDGECADEDGSIEPRKPC